jgi:hypothetical protein
MLSLLKGRFRDCRLVRMSSGDWCLVRDLGLVKGGKGLKHHEVVLALSPRQLTALLSRSTSTALLQSWRRLTSRRPAVKTAVQTSANPSARPWTALVPKAIYSFALARRYTPRSNAS